MIEIPSSVTSIGDGAFSGCASLQTIEIPSSVTSIGDGAFSGCASLQTIEIPSSVTSIEDKAFEDCSSLEILKIMGEESSLSFPLLKGAKLGVELLVESNKYCKFSDCIYNRHGTQLFEFINPNKRDNMNMTEVRIYDYTARICKSAFHNLYGISKVTIPPSVIEIESIAFQKGDSVTDIYIRIENPSRARIDKTAFDGIASNCIFHVPVGSGYAFRNHAAFKRFKDNIVIDK